jgi:branched-chain amino acid transport system ATP-binding protein
VLAERRAQLAGTLSGGEQQMLAVARGLMLRPRLLLLDEPSLGLAPLVVREIFRIVRTINQEQRVSVLLVEQNAAIALRLADRAYLMETGRVVMSGSAAELREHDTVDARTSAIRREEGNLLGCPRPWTSSSSRSCRASPPAASTAASRWRW